MPPRCRTLEEMRALRSCPAEAACSTACAPNAHTAAIVAAHAQAAAAYQAVYAAQALALGPWAPLPWQMRSGEACVPAYQCEHWPLLCATNRPNCAWCATCTRRRLFPETGCT